MYIYIYTHISTYIHTYIYIYTHTVRGGNSEALFRVDV